jgi:hypothetical protein
MLLMVTGGSTWRGYFPPSQRTSTTAAITVTSLRLVIIISEITEVHRVSNRFRPLIQFLWIHSRSSKVNSDYDFHADSTQNYSPNELPSQLKRYLTRMALPVGSAIRS